MSLHVQRLAALAGVFLVTKEREIIGTIIFISPSMVVQ